MVPRPESRRYRFGDGSAGDHRRDCGGWEIRTPEGFIPTRFPSERHRPLGESSSCTAIVPGGGTAICRRTVRVRRTTVRAASFPQAVDLRAAGEGPLPKTRREEAEHERTERGAGRS